MNIAILLSRDTRHCGCKWETKPNVTANL